MADGRPHLSNVGNSCAHLNGRSQFCKGTLSSLRVSMTQLCMEDVALPACLAVLFTPIHLDGMIAGSTRSTLVAFHTAGVVP